MDRFEVIRVYDNDGNTLSRTLNALGDEQFLIFVGETRTPGGTSYYTIVVENTVSLGDLLGEDLLIEGTEQLQLPAGSDDDSKEL